MPGFLDKIKSAASKAVTAVKSAATSAVKAVISPITSFQSGMTVAAAPAQLKAPVAQTLQSSKAAEKKAEETAKTAVSKKGVDVAVNLAKEISGVAGVGRIVEAVKTTSLDPFRTQTGFGTAGNLAIDVLGAIPLIGAAAKTAKIAAVGTAATAGTALESVAKIPGAQSAISKGMLTAALLNPAADVATAVKAPTSISRVVDGTGLTNAGERITDAVSAADKIADAAKSSAASKATKIADDAEEIGSVGRVAKTPVFNPSLALDSFKSESNQASQDAKSAQDQASKEAQENANKAADKAVDEVKSASEDSNKVVAGDENSLFNEVNKVQDEIKNEVAKTDETNKVNPTKDPEISKTTLDPNTTLKPVVKPTPAPDPDPTPKPVVETTLFVPPKYTTTNEPETTTTLSPETTIFIPPTTPEPTKFKILNPIPEPPVIEAASFPDDVVRMPSLQQRTAGAYEKLSLGLDNDFLIDSFDFNSVDLAPTGQNVVNANSIDIIDDIAMQSIVSKQLPDEAISDKIVKAPDYSNSDFGSFLTFKLQNGKTVASNAAGQQTATSGLPFYSVVLNIPEAEGVVKYEVQITEG
jgi:hypothetical protein